MKNLILAIAILITCSACSQDKKEFFLSGKTKGIADGTMLLLRDPLLNIFIDSVAVENNSFILTTKLPDYPYQIVLYKDAATAKIIWAEKNKMTFDASDSDFKDAVITGSVTDNLATQLRSQAHKLKSYKEIVNLEQEFIKNNPNSILSAHNLSVMASVFGNAKSKELFNKLSGKNKESVYGKRVLEFINSDVHKTPLIGDRYIDFAMNDQYGTQQRLSRFGGKVLLLEFWASWCVPCRKENPVLVKTYNDFKDSGFEIVAVSLDEEKNHWINAIKKDNLTWTHLSDLKGRNNIAALAYGVTGIPDNILIDKNGIIIGRNLHGEKLHQKLAEVIAKPNVEITQEAIGMKVKIKSSVTWQDENGKELTQAEAKAMLDSKNYTPELDTDKNIMVVKKI
ncbi:TlpA disulfide reductase family protein [Flavobacterium psychrotrophum]|uniref:TlpA disulfide reductase family protein n=1 Tax=Flavobacterium psychrotrophum TaxID=2294119 RepID=UPI0013C42503|nr:TlpA disulfide reductase family protein [Flavobacterium psychrotrophum]